MKMMKQDDKEILYEYGDIPTFSVIMPIYNGERYLDKAIRSVISQTEKSWELILINDGSIDSSVEICQKYADADNRIILFNKENSGVSDSRNKGLDIAKGDWILFLDADDWFEPFFMLEMKKKIEESSFDFYICNYFEAIDEKRKKPARSLTFGKIENLVFSEIAEASLRQTQWKGEEYYGNLRPVWAKCFKKEYIEKNKLRFYSQLKIGEDMLFVLEYMKYIESICFINHPVYNYRDNACSVMRSNKWNSNEQGKLYFYKAEEIVGKIVDEAAKADLWLETAEVDWRALHASDIGFMQKIILFRKLLDDELYIRFSERRKAVFCLMFLSYCRIQKHMLKKRIEKQHYDIYS